MNKTIQILTSNYFTLRLCLTAILFLGNLSSLCAEEKEEPGNIWGVNAQNQIFLWTGNGWRQVAGELKYVSASADGAVWGVNSKDEVFRWMENSFQPVGSGTLTQISVGSTSGDHTAKPREN